MFAKISTKPGVVQSANVFYNTVRDIITGVITSNSQLNSQYFSTSSCYIINTIPSGWSVVDSSANTVGSNPILPGASPVVIKANWTDSNDYAKYVWLAPQHFGNNVFNIIGIPMEGWDSTLKVAGNTFLQPAAYVSNNSTFAKTHADIISPMNNFLTGNGVTTIISASQSHLLVASYADFNATVFNNYYFLSEYTRDDPWNTVSNGYPSWFIDTTSNSAGVFNASSTTGASILALARINYTANNTDIPWVTSGLSQGRTNWGITTRYVPWSQLYDATFNGVTTSNPYFGGLGCTGRNDRFTPNQNYSRDINKNPARVIAEMRVTGVHNGANLNSNTVFAGGSINTVTPFVYVTNSGWATLDEVEVNGETYMNLIMNNGGLPGTSNISNILVREA